jgi:hypothetical protein
MGMGVQLKEEFIRMFQAFSVGQITDAVNVLKMLDESGFGLADLEEHIALLHQDFKDRENAAMLERSAYLAELSSKSPKCPNCGKQLLLFEVNTRPGNMIGEGAGSMWQCQDLMDCGYELISELTPEGELIKLDINAPTKYPYRPSQVELTLNQSRRRRSFSRSLANKCGRSK